MTLNAVDNHNQLGFTLHLFAYFLKLFKMLIDIS